MRVKINTTSTGAYRFGYKRGPSDTSFVPKEKREAPRGKERGGREESVPRERRSAPSHRQQAPCARIPTHPRHSKVVKPPRRSSLRNVAAAARREGL